MPQLSLANSCREDAWVFRKKKLDFGKARVVQHMTKEFVAILLTAESNATSTESFLLTQVCFYLKLQVQITVGTPVMIRAKFCTASIMRIT